MSNSRPFLLRTQPPYFDAFYFMDSISCEHIHPPHLFYKFLFLIEGNVGYHVGNSDFALMPGDILILPRNTQYISRPNSPGCVKRTVIWFSEELFDKVDPSGRILAKFAQIDRSGGAMFRFSRVNQTTLFTLAHALVDELDYKKELDERMSLALITQLFIQLYRMISLYDTVHEDSQAAELTNAAVRYINEHLSDNLSLEHISDLLYISIYHLERVFKKQTGITLHNYILQRRLSLARQKLYEGQRPTAIYKSCGFSDYSVFYRAFKKRYGISPQQFQQQSLTLMSNFEDSQSVPHITLPLDTR